MGPVTSGVPVRSLLLSRWQAEWVQLDDPVIDRVGRIAEGPGPGPRCPVRKGVPGKYTSMLCMTQCSRDLLFLWVRCHRLLSHTHRCLPQGRGALFFFGGGNACVDLPLPQSAQQWGSSPSWAPHVVSPVLFHGWNFIGLSFIPDPVLSTSPHPTPPSEFLLGVLLLLVIV